MFIRHRLLFSNGARLRLLHETLGCSRGSQGARLAADTNLRSILSLFVSQAKASLTPSFVPGFPPKFIRDRPHVAIDEIRTEWDKHKTRSATPKGATLKFGNRGPLLLLKMIGKESKMATKELTPPNLDTDPLWQILKEEMSLLLTDLAGDPKYKERVNRIRALLAHACRPHS